MIRFSLIALVVLVACSDPSESPPPPVPSEDVERVVQEASSVLEGLDLEGVTVGTELGASTESIMTTDGSMEMGLTDAVLYVRLSEQSRKEISEEIEVETGDMEGLGGRIAQAVTEAVQSGLDTAAQLPLEEIDAMRVEDGRIVIEMVDGEPSPFLTGKVNEQPLLESFDLEDAQRLADAFNGIAGE